MKNFNRLFFGVLFLLAGASAASAEQGKYYSKINMWYEKPEKIMATNYHKGLMIPIGSEVDVLSSSGKKIEFLDKKTGVQFTIRLDRDYMNINETEFFNRYFSKDNILESAEYKSLSSMEKENVRNGTLAAGMSKKAVIMAYGYPPTHRTPSTEANLWYYWRSKMVHFPVQFKDDKLVSGY